jgi:DNA-binding GntR family transcriptional regulator
VVRFPAVSTLSQRISEKLGAEIVAGKLAPGAKLDEEALAARFKVSRSPVRDALRQLAATHLVQSQPRRGFSVALIDPAGLQDMFEAASELEALCARLCALRAGATERKNIERIHAEALAAAKRNNHDAYSRLNEDFHRAIYSGARNRTLETATLALRQRLAPFRSRVFFHVDNRIRSSSREHDAVAAAILKGDAEAAEHAMRGHTASSAMNALEYFRRRVYKNGGLYTELEYDTGFRTTKPKRRST